MGGRKSVKKKGEIEREGVFEGSKIREEESSKSTPRRGFPEGAK